MKVFKPLAITKINDTRYEYSDGYDRVEVYIDADRSQDLYGDQKYYFVSWPDGTAGEYKLTEKGLYALIEKRLLHPRMEKFTEHDFNVACAKTGRLRGVVQVTITSLVDRDFEPSLIGALIDLYAPSLFEKKLKEYEIVGFEEHTLIIMVTVVRRTADD